ncbi:MAG: cobaltochelatase subunit CobN [Tannerella sp.]|jgi:cobaltochelatase CobN|nr:cobaltochelatase subunit CobN [Tannerella sp.]
MRVQRKYIVWLAIVAIVAVVAWFLWAELAAPTRIALVDFQAFQKASIVKANDDKFVEYEEVTADKFGKLTKFDFVLGFGMGMRITAEQRAQIQSAADKGIPLYIYAATNPDNNITNLDSITQREVKAYLDNGNKLNYKNLARYIRKNIDRKRFFITPPDSMQETPADVLYHLSENTVFKKVDDYEAYLKQNGFYRENAPKIAIIGGLNDPFSGNRDNTDSLIVSLQHAGMNVYPVFSVAKRLSFLREINPDGVIYFPHGRLSMGQADAAVEWLRERNIPLFAPLSLLQTQADWEADPMGMSGGFLSQSIVMPELDGSIYPYVVNAQEIDNEGLYLFKAIPERLETFTRIINSFIALKRKNNADKRLAIYYFKGPGQSALAAQGLETVPSLYNLLKRLRTEGYKVENLPGDVREFEKLLMTQGAVLSPYAEGAFDDYLQNGNPALVGKSDYETWVAEELPSALYEDVVGIYGDAPGEYMAVGDSIAVAQVRFGNIVLLPQPMAGLGNDAFAIVHGAKTAPPHTYIASYLWSSHAFHADAILHFGTHGSLEFTPSKQVALSAYDWPDRLVGATPHFYYYTIGNVGESMMAKRRSYATLVSYLTPAFSETDMRGEFKELQNLIRRYRTESDKNISDKIKQLTLKMGLHRDLRIDSLADFTADDIERIENFAEEIANEKMSGELYTSGIAYSPDKNRTTVLAMSADPIAYSIAALDRLNGEVSDNKLKNKVFFTERYLKPAQELVSQILKGKLIGSEHICTIARIKPQDLDEARQILTPPRRSMPVGGAQVAHQQYTPEQRRRARAIAEIERTVNNVTVYKKALEESPEQEFQSLLNALGGGYTAPSSGGDAVANPAAVPTGRNLYSINAEATPSESAWEKGVALVNATLEQYRKQHGDYPRKVSYTFWSSEFIESEGTTVAQVLYMLGVEPVRDAFGRVSDLQLIPAADLQRPRIDVVVQTSGQFRDLAASRLTLINRAVEMAAAASDNDNRVAASATETERLLVEQGIPPLQARELSTQRIFGGINGMYGTGIQGMVTGSDRWDSEKEIADVYINNMGAVYGSDKTWGAFHDGLLRAALHNTDVVVQPRQSNTWGALSLDHVYEFMGGLNLAVRSVTGKDPDAFFADYRNRNNARIQELKEAIGVEARSTIFNPAYIREVMKGNAASAERITEVVTNTFGWNVMKPNVIDREIWDKIYEVYIKDDYGLGVEAFFRRENPFALQEITAVMLETARKGMWQASEQQLADLARLHSALVKDYGSAASGFSGGNAKLHDFIAQKLDNTSASDYRRQLQKMQTAAPSPDSKSGVVMKKETLNTPPDREKNTLNGAIVVTVVLCVFVILLLILRKKRKA